MPADIDEAPFEGEHPLNYVRRMAAEKAMTISEMAPDRIVLAADTSVVVDDDILGKPSNRDDFIRMFTRLSGTRHKVISAVCAMIDQEGNLNTCVSHVDFREVSRDEMMAYWATGEPADKAGGYGIQQYGGIFVKNIAGSFSGIMGLPIYETVQLLQDVGVNPLEGQE